MNRNAPLVLVALLLIIPGGAWVAGYADRLTDQSSGAIPACETATKDGLVFPSSYRRVSAKFTPREHLEIKEFVDAAESGKCPVSQRTHGCESATPTADALVEQYLASQQLKKEGADNERPDRAVVRKTMKRVWANEFQTYNSMPAAEKRTGFVTLEYDAEDVSGALRRTYGFCRFSAIGADGKFDPESIILIGH